MNELIPANKNQLTTTSSIVVPVVIGELGDRAVKRYLEFFAAQIRNPNTRAAYARAARRLFDWCDDNGIDQLHDIEPVHIAAWVELRMRDAAAPTVKQELAGVRQLFDWLVIGQVIASNPADAVRGPKHSVKVGKTPVLSAEEARQLLQSIPTDTIGGLRDRALIATMTYTFARISATVQMNVKDIFIKKRRHWVRLHEKGGQEHEMPCHHTLEQYLQDYMDAAGIDKDKDGPLFRTMDRRRRLTKNRLNRTEAWYMVRRRAAQAGIDTIVCNHTFRGTGLTAYLENPEARLEHAQQMANHSDPKTTKLYDRRSDEVSLDEVERITI